MIQIAIMGHGVVGSGVAEVLTANRESIEKRAKDKISIKYILDLRTFPESPYADRFTTDFERIVTDPEVRVVVETMGGLKPAYEYVSRCLRAGKSVVTSNKELVAVKGAELLRIARDENVNFLFEASVGGGIPIIRPIAQCLAANELEEIHGILNGTTNFILTKMIRDRTSFADALALAQRLGYAERDPSADVDGLDACRKICILASLAFGRHVYPEQVPTQGISGVTLADVAYAAEWGGVVKLVASVKRLEDGRVAAQVGPALVPHASQLSTVDDVFNAVMVRGNAIGDVMFYGKGAGKLPTASAVVADVIDCVKHLSARKYLYWEEGALDYAADPMEERCTLYLRVPAPDPDAARHKIAALFPQGRVLPRHASSGSEVAFLTGEDVGRVLLERAEELHPALVMRVLED